MTISLFDDQAALIDDVRDRMRRTKSVLMQAPTGSGKTVMTAAMIQSARDKGTRAMMVVPRRELLRQTAETFRAFSIPHSYVSAGYEFNPFAKTMLATSGTLARRLDRVPVPQVVFIDETHYGGGELDRVIKHYQAAGSWVIGLSATPIRLDGKGLGMWYQSLAEGPTIGDLIHRQRLSRFRMFAPASPDLSGVKTSAGDYAKGQLADRMEGDRVLVGNAVEHYRKHALGRLNVCYCVSIKHAEIVAAAFNGAGVPAACITGKMDDAERTRLIRSFARRELLVLTSVDLLTFGFDLGSAAQMDVTVECMSDLGPTKSLAKQMQKWGRVLRMKPDPALIFDHAGNAAQHGMPDDAREWSLAGKPKRDSDGERQEPVRQCAECYYVHRPAPTCPACGFVYPVQAREVEEVDGELSEVTGAAPFKRQQGMAKDLDGLIAVGRQRGMRHPEAWAAKVMTARMAKRAGAG